MEKFIIKLNGIFNNVNESLSKTMIELSHLKMTPLLKFKDDNYFIIIIVNEDDEDAHEYLYDLLGPYEIQIENDNLKIEII